MNTQSSDEAIPNPIADAVATQDNQPDIPQLVSSLTVDELKELIAQVVDARLNSFFNSLNINDTKKSTEPEKNELNIEPRTLCYAYEEPTDDLNTHEYSKEYEDKVIQARNNLRQVENFLASTVEVSKLNPWLKMAGKYQNDPYFEQMLESIAEYRREQDAELDEYYLQMETAENNSSFANPVHEVVAL